MHRSRFALVVLLVLGVVGFAVPAVTLAAGSAGDQQYTDPFGASSGSRKPSAPAPPAATPAPASTTPAATTPTATTPTTTPTATAQTSTVTSTATAATSRAKSKTLPFTGYDGRLAVLLGVGLLLGGAGLRVALRHR